MTLHGSTDMREPASPSSAPLHWTLARFDALEGRAVYELLALRARVFVVEQACAYLDPDGLDLDAWHLLGRDGDGSLVACLRLLAPGARFAECSIGRVITAPERRREGLGRTLMEEGMRRARLLWPASDVRISAQRYLERFYGSLGFVTDGAPYDEDGIPHVDMLLRR